MILLIQILVYMSNESQRSQKFGSRDGTLQP